MAADIPHSEEPAEGLHIIHGGPVSVPIPTSRRVHSHRVSGRCRAQEPRHRLLITVLIAQEFAQLAHRFGDAAFRRPMNQLERFFDVLWNAFTRKVQRREIERAVFVTGVHRLLKQCRRAGAVPFNAHSVAHRVTQHALRQGVAGGRGPP
jgi:hypothetical protein